MSSAFTVLWNSERVKIAKTRGLVGLPIPFLFGGPHSSQPSFIRAGVKPSDIVYPIHVKAGVVYVLAKVVTKEILPIAKFRETCADLYDALGYPGYLPPWYKAVCWTCTEEALMAADSSPCSVSVKLTPEMVTRLTYRSQRAERTPKGIKEGEAAFGDQCARRVSPGRRLGAGFRFSFSELRGPADDRIAGNEQGGLYHIDLYCEFDPNAAGSISENDGDVLVPQ